MIKTSDVAGSVSQRRLNAKMAAQRLDKKERMRLKREQERREKACTGKDAFPTEAAAMGYRTHVIKRGRRNKGMIDMSAYRCTFCDQWHLGHQA